MKKMFFRSYVPAKGFGWAVFCMVVTFILVCYGVVEKNIFVLVLSLVFGIVGLYFTKKSWVSYKPRKKKHFLKKR